MRKFVAKIASLGFEVSRADVTRLQQFAQQASIDSTHFQWIRQTLVYESWLSRKESMILWHADPQRRDTSLLVLSLVNGDPDLDIRERENSTKPCIVSYFCNPNYPNGFFRDSRPSFEFEAGFLVLHSIISQLLHQEPDLVDSVLRGMPQPLEGRVLLVDCFIRPQRWAKVKGKEALHQLLSRVLNLRRHTDLRVYIDGLTKLDTKGRSDVLSTLLRITSDHSQHCKVFITTELKDDVCELLEGSEYVDQSTERKGTTLTLLC